MKSQSSFLYHCSEKRKNASKSKSHIRIKSIGRSILVQMFTVSQKWVSEIS